jgi:hypothetical protein
VSDPLSNASPVGPVGGFPQRARQDEVRHKGEGAGRRAPHRPRDGVDLHAPEGVARRLIRERVIARTREGLELRPGEDVPRWAEAVDSEPVGAFLGRLLSAQNQLAALRVRELPQRELRRRLDEAMRAGVEEVVEMLTKDAADERALAAVEVVAEVLAEYGRRLEALS